MIKRKYVIIFLSLYILLSLTVFASASLLAPIISKLAPAAAAATGTGGGFTIPAKVLATTSTGAKVASWVSLAVPSLTGAKVAAAILGVTGALAADYLMAKGALWFAANKYTKDDGSNTPEGQPAMPFNVTNSNVSVPNGTTADDYRGTAPWNSSVMLMGMYSNGTTAKAARDDFKSAYCGQYDATGLTGTPIGGVNYYSVACSGTNYWFGFTAASTPKHNEDSKTPVPMYTVQNKLKSDLDAENANAKNVAKAALEVTANAMDNPSHPLAQNTNVYNNINNYLTTNLTSNQITNLEAAATPAAGDDVIADEPPVASDQLTPAQIAAAVQAALAGQGLSASQIAAAIAAVSTNAGGLSSAETTAAVTASLQNVGLTPAQIAAAIAAASPALTQTAVKTAVKEALDDVTDVPAVVDPTIIIPEKLSLTAVMQSFVNTIKALPIFAALNGITINVSGSSMLCINLPSNLGGSKCWDGSNMQNGLNMIGSAFLGLTTILSFVGIFKG